MFDRSIVPATPSRNHWSLILATVAVLLASPARMRAATFTVDMLPDATYGTCSDVVPADCSLRDAVSRANANAGPDTIIVPPGIYRLTRTPAGENANAGGDLDVTDDITIIGGGGNPDADPSLTVIQSGSLDTSPGNGFDKVLSINPNWDKVVNASISAVTIRFGNNPSPFSGDGYGGGIDVEATPYNNAALPGAGSLTIHNCVITGNRTTDADGGGIAVVNGLLRTGALLKITNSAITSNVATDGNGGGSRRAFRSRSPAPPSTQTARCSTAPAAATAAESTARPAARS